MDGQGGRLGQKLVESIKKAMPDIYLLAIGTNSTATEKMLKSGADAAATGENAAIVACRTADLIVGPLGIVMADALLGEITPRMAAAVASSAAARILIPMNLCDTYVAGVNLPPAAVVQDAITRLQALISEDPRHA